MSEFQVSAALLRTLPRLAARVDPELEAMFQTGQATRPATQAHRRQEVWRSVERVVTKSRRRAPPEEREKEIRRRRAWAGGSGMPPAIRASYSEAERAALTVIADRCRSKGFCDLCIDEIARLSGVGRTSVQNAIRKARSKERGHISVRERPQERGKNLTNIIQIICGVWLSWIARAIGFKRLNTSEIRVKNSLSEQAETGNLAFEGRQPMSDDRNGCPDGGGGLMSLLTTLPERIGIAVPHGTPRQDSLPAWAGSRGRKGSAQ